MTIRARLILSVAAVFAVSAVMFLAIWSMLDDLESDGLGINLAGRQRMLTQMAGQQALLGRLGGQDAAQGLSRAAAVFEATHKALLDGGFAPVGLDPNGATVALPAASPAVRAELEAAGARWTGFIRLVRDGAANPSEVSAASATVLESLSRAVTVMQKESEAKVARLLTMQAAAVAVGFALLIVVVVNMRRHVTEPLDALRGYAGKVASGDLSASVSGRFSAELLAVKEAVQSMVLSLRESMGHAEAKGREAEKGAAEAREALAVAKAQEEKVQALFAALTKAADAARGVSRQLAAGSRRLGEQASGVSQGAQLQRDRMAETAAAMEEMNATVGEVARNAGDAATNAGAAHERAQAGAEGVRAAIVAIDRARARMEELSASMERLGEQAQGIGQVMNVISDIADQTNLLALNAAIEAARAGDAGRGFAVVADEVRKLAEKTMTATKEVGQAVTAIQGLATENVVKAREAAEGIVESTGVAEESGRRMAEIVDIVAQTSGQVESIATASEQQSAAAEEINRAVTEVTRVAAETAEGMRETDVVVAELGRLVEELDGIIGSMTRQE
ncbi:methyl-accepting chemotaxis sensory transducer [Alkalidesulfovibrio alkalitolerans DSM 16529]|uniref:Methyl-accepting chemotaxis sensory transducer n=1 Tax=Alkalidesulfovibrio alkalitolerans DSM 16529 TaxID=1121439 RepID=S7UH58_9BACT|nr:methyl-accepting chemotaxis protein [Alkalidesulfovibrio alkalitolerans]EPR33174.1 methyl-accepting chemotaxis sensory transducer [Alkalidesulfovibrio alkalitolerans DSM 16529]